MSDTAPTPENRAIYGRVDGVKIFAALAHSRPGNLESLSTEINQWLAENPGLVFVDIIVKLQGAEAFIWHTVTMLYRFPPGVTQVNTPIPHAAAPDDQSQPWVPTAPGAGGQRGPDPNAPIDLDD